MIYAILDADGNCINRTVWDGHTDWQPPEGCTAVPDPNRKYQIVTVAPDNTVFPELTASEKLAASGLSVEDLKNLLGLS